MTSVRRPGGELPDPSPSFEEFQAVPSEAIAGIATSVSVRGARQRATSAFVWP
jgi:hypothetical protein